MNINNVDIFISVIIILTTNRCLMITVQTSLRTYILLGCPISVCSNMFENLPNPFFSGAKYLHFRVPSPEIYARSPVVYCRMDGNSDQT